MHGTHAPQHAKRAEKGPLGRGPGDDPLPAAAAASHTLQSIPSRRAAAWRLPLPPPPAMWCTATCACCTRSRAPLFVLPTVPAGPAWGPLRARGAGAAGRLPQVSHRGTGVVLQGGGHLWPPIWPGETAQQGYSNAPFVRKLLLSSSIAKWQAVLSGVTRGRVPYAASMHAPNGCLPGVSECG